MIAPDDRVLVALSGGPDSTALLHALWLLRERLQCELACAHVHHGLRGADADADARHAEQQAASLGLPFVLKHAAVRDHARARHLSLEAAARELRYRLLEEAADALGTQRIATGHTASDLAETVLLNMLRGTSVSGLAAMPPVRGRIIRPLIQATRIETKRFCEEEDLAYRVDKSNLDPAHLRNRVRHELMPVLRGLQPQAEAALCRLARLAREEDDLLAQQAQEAFRRIATRSGNELSIVSQEFARLPLALRRRVAHIAIAVQAGGKADVESERVDAVAALIAEGQTGARVELPRRLEARRVRGRVVIGPARPRPAPAPGLRELSVPGSVSMPELGCRPGTLWWRLWTRTGFRCLWRCAPAAQAIALCLWA